MSKEHKSYLLRRVSYLLEDALDCNQDPDEIISWVTNTLNNIEELEV